MKIEKGEHIYTITETANTWNIKTDISKLGVSYTVPKEICKTIDDVKKYIAENNIF